MQGHVHWISPRVKGTVTNVSVDDNQLVKEEQVLFTLDPETYEASLDQEKAAFRLPGGIIIPLLGDLSCLGLIYYLPPTSWLRFVAWLNVGFVIYVCYGSVHSKLTALNAADRHLYHAHIAHAGAWLALMGTLALFLLEWRTWLDWAFPGIAVYLKTLTGLPYPWLSMPLFYVHSFSSVSMEFKWKPCLQKL